MQAFTRFAAVSRSRRLIKALHATTPTCEALDPRRLFTATLYIDYGDRFAGGVYNTTVGELDNTTAPGNPNIDGPRLRDASGNAFTDATTLAITSLKALYSGTALNNLRTTMDTLVQRFYQGLDITVVDLTSDYQTVNGHSVRAAENFLEASQTLGVNEGDAKNNDAYVFVGKFQIGASLYNPATNAYGGIATGTDIASQNNNDGSAVVILLGSGDSATFNGNQIAHESGHTFGMQHAYRQTAVIPSISNTTATPAQYDRLHQSEMMSYLGYSTLGGFNDFSRYPTMRGDGNTNANALTTTPTPFDAMANDPNIGASPFVTYITGTGENDTINITKTGANAASVSVTAYDNAAYTIPVDAPGLTGNTYTYSVDLTKPLLIDAGGRDDRITITGDLGVGVTVRGMHGTDSLFVVGDGTNAATYTPDNTNTANGLDGNANRRGKVTLGSTVVNFQEFESTSVVQVSDVASLSVTTPLAADTLTLSNLASTGSLTGSSGGIAIVGLRFIRVGVVNLDTAASDAGTAVDNVALAPGTITGLTNLNVITGGGADTITYNGIGVVANVNVNAGLGSDSFSITASADNTPLFHGGGGSDQFSLQSGVWNVANDLGADGSAASVTVVAGTAVFQTGQHLRDVLLTNSGNATLAASGTNTLFAKTLSVGGNARFDLTNNAMVIDYSGSSPVSTIGSFLSGGYAGGAWNGPGINSSTAAVTPGRTLGYGEASDLAVLPALFTGADATSVLIRYTLPGDATLDATVNFDDLILLAQNYNTSGKTFTQGNFDYDAGGNVNFDDLILLAQNYNQSLPVASISSLVATAAKRKPPAHAS